jgi:hypothetical protein
MVDTSEGTLARERLMTPVVQALYHKCTQRNIDPSGAFGSPWGGTERAFNVVNGAYHMLFEHVDSAATLDAFLLSLSTHAIDSELDRQNGILSQWNAYAPCGYCLVLDTPTLCQMLGREMDSRYWVKLSLNPVLYDDAPIEQAFPELIDSLAETSLQAPHVAEVDVTKFLACVTTLKLAKFRPEREFRIVAIPGTEQLAARAAVEHPLEFRVGQPLPTINIKGEDRRYVSLFGEAIKQLPIRRIIVGPGDRQDERAELAGSLLPDVPITISQCAVGGGAD